MATNYNWYLLTTVLTICGISLEAAAPLPKGYPSKTTTLGDYLKQYRIDNCYTAFEVSLELNVYESTIHKWEGGDSKPTPKNKQKIIEFMGYDPLLTKTEYHEYIKK
ncbi:helix-turn-helix transcriptional regulator [uncultured Psychroserpens sp.]|uniref:helix-turn-helix domain-containing protein n=1 Tax=uncultured Psychroserpens sp. TaxID=255436 RepID=UPI002601B819|nr:helix-turn-helix transcriptional regulator [uncultured Psychroserpens sp.]